LIHPSIFSISSFLRLSIWLFKILFHWILMKKAFLKILNVNKRALKRQFRQKLKRMSDNYFFIEEELIIYSQLVNKFNDKNSFSLCDWQSLELIICIGLSFRLLFVWLCCSDFFKRNFFEAEWFNCMISYKLCFNLVLRSCLNSTFIFIQWQTSLRFFFICHSHNQIHLKNMLARRVKVYTTILYKVLTPKIFFNTPVFPV